MRKRKEGKKETRKEEKQARRKRRRKKRDGRKRRKEGKTKAGRKRKEEGRKGAKAQTYTLLHNASQPPSKRFAVSVLPPPPNNLGSQDGKAVSTPNPVRIELLALGQCVSLQPCTLTTAPHCPTPG